MGGTNTRGISTLENIKNDTFYNCWTRKEAFIKATGDGLSRFLDSFEVSLTLEKPAQLLSENGNQLESSRWSLWALVPAPGFAGALAVEGSFAHLKQIKIHLE